MPSVVRGKPASAHKEKTLVSLYPKLGVLLESGRKGEGKLTGFTSASLSPVTLAAAARAFGGSPLPAGRGRRPSMSTMTTNLTPVLVR